MRKYFVICLTFISTLAHANLYIENGGRVYFNEIDCLASEISKDDIVCDQYNQIMVCSTLFSAKLRTGETETLQVSSETVVASDSKLWQKISFGMIDKLNAKSAKIEGKFELKTKIKELEEIGKCDLSDE